MLQLAVIPVALTTGVQDTVLSGSLVAAIAVAGLAGLVSFFSPCCLPLVPVYLGYVTGVGGDQHGSGSAHEPHAARARIVAGTALFVLGFAAVFTSYGAAFGQLGSSLMRHQDLLVRVAGALTVAMGLLFLGALERLPLLNRTFRPSFAPRAGLLGAPALGGLFAVGWTPCIGPTLAAVLTLSTTSATASRGALLTFVYSLGLGLPFLVAAVSFNRASTSFAWVRGHMRGVTRAGGVFLILVGAAQLSGLWTTAMVGLQGVISGWQSPL